MNMNIVLIYKTYLFTLHHLITIIIIPFFPKIKTLNPFTSRSPDHHHHHPLFPKLKTLNPPNSPRVSLHNHPNFITFNEQAIEYVKQAVQEDNAGNYAKLFPPYMNALEYFKTHLKYEKNPKIREAVTQKFTERRLGLFWMTVALDRRRTAAMRTWRRARRRNLTMGKVDLMTLPATIGLQFENWRLLLDVYCQGMEKKDVWF
ncbi:putative vesicle-fusing ATPase [Helianthus debilis subsp. tardiflorus]